MHDGKKVKIYWNLHKKCYSVQHKGKVIFHSHSFLFLKDVTLKVSAAGNARVRAEGKKNVHAFVCGTLVEGGIGLSAEAKKITYNPYAYTTFVDAATKTPVYEAKSSQLKVITNPDGSRRPEIVISQGAVQTDDLMSVLDDCLNSAAA